MLKIESNNTEPNNLTSESSGQYFTTEFEEVKAQEIVNDSKIFHAREAKPLPGGQVEVGRVTQELIGMLLIEGKAVGIVRASKAGKTRFIVTKIDPEGKKFTFVDVLKPGLPLVIGRDNIDKDNNFISRKHAELTLSDDAELMVEDTSTNGSVFVQAEKQRDGDPEKKAIISSLKRILGRDEKVKESVSINQYIDNPKNWGVFGVIPNLVFEEDFGSVNGDVMWDYTRIPTKETSRGSVVRGYEEPYVDSQGVKIPAHYLDRPVINRDTVINGGVYFVPGIQEAIVVDDGTKPKRGDRVKEMNPQYDKALRNFISSAKARGIDILHGVKDKDIPLLLETVLATVMEIIRYDVEIAESAEKYFADRKINLDSFIANGKGVCRHQALLVGYLLERCIKGGYLAGSISVDRNAIKGHGGHAWARFTNRDGKVYIVDPAQGYVGSLEHAKISSSWSYQRPEDDI